MWNYVALAIAGCSSFWIAASLGYLYFYAPSAVVSGGAQPADRRGGAPSRGGNRRRAVRFAAQGDVTLAWQTNGDRAESVRGSLVDMSEGGAAVKCPFDFAPGTYLYIEVPHLQSATTANVRHSAASGRRWVVGLEFRGPLYRK